MATTAAIWDSLSQWFELFFIYKSLRCFLSSFKSIGLTVQKKKGKIDFQDGRHIGLPMGTILAIFFIYKLPWCFLSSFESIGLTVQKKKGRIDFQDGRHLWFLIGTILAIFISTSHPNPSYQSFLPTGPLVQENKQKKKSFKMAAMMAILDFWSKQFKLF